MHGNESHKLFGNTSIDQRVIFWGNAATILGVSLISLGSVLRLFRTGKLPDTPVFPSQSKNVLNNHGYEESNNYRGNNNHTGNYFRQ